MVQCCPFLDVGQINAGVLVDRQRTIFTFRRGHETKPSLLFRFAEPALLIFGLETVAFGKKPDLVQVHGFSGRVIELAVAHAGAGRHALQFAGPDGGTVAHAVLVLQAAIQDIRDNFHIAVTVHAEALAWLHAVFIHDPERAKAHLPGVIIIGEGKGVVGVKPAVVGMAALCRFTYLDHGLLRTDFELLDVPHISLYINYCKVKGQSQRPRSTSPLRWLGYDGRTSAGCAAQPKR